MYLATIISVVLLLFGFLVYQGVFKRMIVTEKAFPHSLFIFSQYQGNYKDIHSAFEDMMELISENEKANKLLTECNMSLAAVYYDDPHNLKDPTLARALLGMILPKEFETNTDIIAYFRKFGFETARIPSTRSLFTSFECKGAFTESLGPAKAYTAIINHVLDKNNDIDSYDFFTNEGPAIEIYKEDITEYWMFIDNKLPSSLSIHNNPALLIESSHSHQKTD